MGPCQSKGATSVQQRGQHTRVTSESGLMGPVAQCLLTPFLIFKGYRTLELLTRRKRLRVTRTLGYAGVRVSGALNRWPLAKLQTQRFGRKLIILRGILRYPGEQCTLLHYGKAPLSRCQKSLSIASGDACFMSASSLFTVRKTDSRRAFCWVSLSTSPCPRPLQDLVLLMSCRIPQSLPPLLHSSR